MLVPQSMAYAILAGLPPVYGLYASTVLSVLGRQCLDRRVPDFETLQAETQAWQEGRDAAGGRIDWRFSTDDARIKLKRLYPSLRE